MPHPTPPDLAAGSCHLPCLPYPVWNHLIEWTCRKLTRQEAFRWVYLLWNHRQQLHSFIPSSDFKGVERSQEDSTDGTTVGFKEKLLLQSWRISGRCLLILSLNFLWSVLFILPSSSNHSCCFCAKSAGFEVTLKCGTHGTSWPKRLSACRVVLLKQELVLHLQNMVWYIHPKINVQKNGFKTPTSCNARCILYSPQRTMRPRTSLRWPCLSGDSATLLAAYPQTLPVSACNKR